MIWNIKMLAQQLLALCTALVFSASFSTIAFANDAVAMVTDLKGNASITSNGEQKACEILMSTFSGDEIRVNANSKLTLVYFKSAKEYTFPEHSIIKINTEVPENKSGSKATTRDLEIAKNARLLPVDDEYSQAAIVFRSARKKSKIKLIRPVRSKVLSSQPTFEWHPLEENLQYRFVLTDDSGRTVIETLVNGNSFKLPTENSIKDGIVYSWQVEARLSTGAVYSNSTNFSLIDKGELEKINRLRPKDNATFSERIVFAVFLQQIGVRGEARSYWKTLSTERPDNTLLKGKAKE